MKRIALFVSLVLFGCAVNAGAMYWQTSSLKNNTNVADSKWTYAQVNVYSQGKSVGYLKTWDGASWENTDYYNKNSSSTGVWFDLTGYEGTSPAYSFVLELVNEDWEVQGLAMKASSYTDIANQGVIVDSFSTIAPIPYNSWNQGYVVIPEPTGGVMLLLGASLLALRRKQRV